MARSVGVDRMRVVAVAADVADEYGLDQLTLAAVASRLGVKLPSLYNHVDGLAGLRRELAWFGARQLYERISRAAIGKAEDAAVLAISHAYRAYITEHPGVYAATVQAPTPDDLELTQISQSLIEVILVVLEPYELDEVGGIHAVRGLRSIIHGFATLELSGAFALPLDRDESFLRLLRAYIGGLRAQKAQKAQD